MMYHIGLMCKGVRGLVRTLDVAIPSPGQIMLAAALYSRTHHNNRPIEAIAYYPHNPHSELVVARPHYYSMSPSKLCIPIFLCSIIAIILFTVMGSCRLWTMLLLSFATGFWAGRRVAQSRMMHF